MLALYAAALDPAINAELGLDPLTPASILADLPATCYNVLSPLGALSPFGSGPGPRH